MSDSSFTRRDFLASLSAAGVTTLAGTTIGLSDVAGGGVTVAGGLVTTAASGAGGRGGAGGWLCICSFSWISLRTSPGFEIFDRSILGRISAGADRS